MKIRNWQRFQHFKDRRPPWIKLYRDLLDDPDWHELPGDDAKLLMMLWLVASEHDGELPSMRKLAFRLRMTEKQVSDGIQRLSAWIDHVDITLISDCYQDDAPETEKRQRQSERKAQKRAATLPKDFQITEEMKAWAAENKMRFDLGAETSKFRDYHAAKGSTFKDWTAAWRNWMRKAVEFRGPVDDEGAASVPPQAPPGCNQSDYEAMDSDSRVAAWERWNAHISKVRGVA